MSTVEGAAAWELVVHGRNVVVPDHYRQHVADKLSKLERHDTHIIRIDVELYHEPNRRQHAACQRVEATVRTRGPLVRAEACAGDFYQALDAVIRKLDARLRHAAGKHGAGHGHGRHGRQEITPAGPPLEVLAAELTAPTDAADAPAEPDEPEQSGPGQVVRIKDHPDEPMTVDDALLKMELVGHDFYLFHDKDSDRPSVVYRRHAYQYGLIRLG